MSASLVGSEMCIRDRAHRTLSSNGPPTHGRPGGENGGSGIGCWVGLGLGSSQFFQKPTSPTKQAA
eukprot:6081098-Alexandrium_andersonii.AAC.1